MKFTSLQKWAFVALITSLLTSCQDHRQVTDPQRFRLKKTVGSPIVLPPNDDIITFIYDYNAQGKLTIELSSFSSPAGVVRSLRTSTFTYDSQTKLTRIDSQFIPETGTLYRYDYIYDANGNIATETFSADVDKPHTGNYQVISKKTYTYNGSLFPATMTSEILPATRSSELGKQEYTYSNGDIVKQVFTPKNPNQTTTTGIYQYDDKPNPYYGLIRGDGFGTGSFSKNNLIGFVPQGNDLTTYTYNSLGLVTKRVAHISGFNYDLQTTYEYEAY